jgi:small Trp-rich protein
MYLVVLGVFFLAMKLAEWGPVAGWSYWVVLMPFGAAAVWWTYADKSGWTQRQAMDKMEARKDERRRKNLDALGIGDKGRRRP